MKKELTNTQRLINLTCILLTFCPGIIVFPGSVRTELFILIRPINTIHRVVANELLINTLAIATLPLAVLAFCGLAGRVLSFE